MVELLEFISMSLEEELIMKEGYSHRSYQRARFDLLLHSNQQCLVTGPLSLCCFFQSHVAQIQADLLQRQGSSRARKVHFRLRRRRIPRLPGAQGEVARASQM